MGRRFSWLLSYGAICSLLALGASVFRGQESGLEALTEEQVVSLVTSSKLGAASAERIVEIIKKRGLQFSITEAFLLELQARETDPVILEALRALRRPGSESTEQPEADWSRFLELVRAKALAYTDDLPDFICTQVTQRHVRSPPQRSWRPVDNFVAELTYFDKKEHYKILTVANNAATDPTIENLSGTISTGEFGTEMRSLFDPAANTSFRLEGRAQSNGHETIRIGYEVPRKPRGRTIIFTYNTEQGMNTKRTIVTAYRGRCWIDPTSFQLVRLEHKALDIPKNFPIVQSEGATDYDLTDIEGKKYWLPVRAEVLLMVDLVDRGERRHTRNVIEFKRYRKFEAEVRIAPD
jgi:hypothetical protein